MAAEHSLAVAEKAKQIYENRLRADLEAEHRDKFVAIEPDSGEHFIGSTYSEAVAAASRAHPDRISFVIRIGHEAAIQLGAATN